MHFDLKIKDKWEPFLKSVINKRYSQLDEDDCGKSSEFDVLSKLDKEVSWIYPSIGFDFKAEVVSNFTEISRSIIAKNGNLIQNELEMSSENNLYYLSEIITRKRYLEDKLVDVETAHTDFLRKEYFNIIHGLYPKKEQIHVFEGNREKILENQIKNDLEKIYKKYGRLW